MKAMRNVLVSALACALVSAAPSRAVQPNAAAPAPAQPAPAPGEPKWVDSMQRLVKDLSDENLKMRREIKDLQDQKERLSRALADCEARLEKQRENQGALNVPPNVLVAPPAPKGNQVPPNWQPFEFNGTTYYVVPLSQQRQQAAAKAPGAASPSSTIILPEAKK
jgi:hypothetical protein